MVSRRNDVAKAAPAEPVEEVREPYTHPLADLLTLVVESTHFSTAHAKGEARALLEECVEELNATVDQTPPGEEVVEESEVESE